MEYQADSKARLDGQRANRSVDPPLSGSRRLPCRHGLLGKPHRQTPRFTSAASYSGQFVTRYLAVDILWRRRRELGQWLLATILGYFRPGNRMASTGRKRSICLESARVYWLFVAPMLETSICGRGSGTAFIGIVFGGETGAKDARYMEPDWARDLRDQCYDAGAALFLEHMWKRKAIPADLMVREYPVV
jgi:hypothetical protein